MRHSLEFHLLPYSVRAVVSKHLSTDCPRQVTDSSRLIQALAISRQMDFTLLRVHNQPLQLLWRVWTRRSSSSLHDLVKIQSLWVMNNPFLSRQTHFHHPKKSILLYHMSFVQINFYSGVILSTIPKNCQNKGSLTVNRLNKIFFCFLKAYLIQRIQGSFNHFNLNVNNYCIVQRYFKRR